MVGSRFCELQTGFQLIKADLNGEEISLDLTNRRSIESFFNNYEFEEAILFSAFTDVDAAEKQRGDKNEIAWKINVDGAEIVAKLANKLSRKLIFISSETVFDGKNGPYKEEDLVGQNLNKISWYGITKIKAEEAIQELSSNYTIVRICYPYRGRYAKKADFAKQILKKFDEDTLYPLFTDQIITPTFIDDLAPVIALIVNKQLDGIFHIASPKITTPYDFANFLLETFGRDPSSLKKASLETFLEQNKATPRPIKGGLDVSKISGFGFIPTAWEDGIKEIFKESNGKLI
jgi:dTDP-4-dehydrorhamnose reductase